MLAAWLHNLNPDLLHIGRFSVKWYGISYVLSALAGYWLYRKLAERGRTDVAPSKVADMITAVGFFGVLLGGRIGWILFYGIHQNHDADPWYWWLRVWEGGMASHGGILGIVIVTF